MVPGHQFRPPSAHFSPYGREFYTIWPRAKLKATCTSQSTNGTIQRSQRLPQPTQKGKAGCVPLTTFHKWPHQLYYKQTSMSKKIATLLICWWHLLILLPIYKERGVCSGVLPGDTELDFRGEGTRAVCTSLQWGHHIAFSIITRQKTRVTC